MKKKIYFYSGNHENSKSIDSYYLLCKKKFSHYNIILSKVLKKNSVNIIMEGFDKKQYLKIAKNKNDNFKVILIITEFLDIKNRTFNSFDKKKSFSIKYFFFYLLIYIYQFLKLNNYLWFKKIYNYLNLKKKFSSFPSVELAKDTVRMKKRFIYFEEILSLSSLIYCSHEKIKKDLIKFYNRESYLIFPILKKIKKKKFNKKIKFSGSLTSYRKKILKKFNLNYKSYGFFINDRKKNYIYSIHPKKNLRWFFSSPIRYIDSILYGEIPLTIEKFVDNYDKLLSIKLTNTDKIGLNINKKKYSSDIKNINNKILNFNKSIKFDDLKGKTKLKTII